MRKVKNFDDDRVPSIGKEKNYDEKRVPSRLAKHYTHFGWVRARNRVSEELDRKTQGIRLKPSEDKHRTEAIRRKKRFGYNQELVYLEREYMKRLERYGKGSTLVMILGCVFLIAAILCLIITLVPKYPTTIEESNAMSEGQKKFNDIGLQINGALFYGEQYFVLDADVSKNVTETGTVVTVSGSITKAYRSDNDGQIVEVNLGALKGKLTLNEDGNVNILRVEKVNSDSNEGGAESYRYYILYDTEKAPLGVLAQIATKLPKEVADILPAAMLSGLAVLSVLILIVAIIFFIWGICLTITKKKNLKNPNLLFEAERIVASMKEEDPGLMGRSQRHFYSWQKLVSGAINMSNVAKNDNSGDDGESEDEFLF